MKPNFALHLTHEGITLLHRAKAGWLRIGDVDLGAPDFEEQLKVLRQTASDLESGGITSKLVIPESQILYTQIDVRGRDIAAQIAQIREGLIGLTPYEVKDLVFDWRTHAKRAQVAVVARDTLQEAESFAAEFRFNPVSFVAMPEPGSFEGEPFFGPTKHAATLLKDGERVDPDKVAMVVMSVPRPKPQIRVGAAKPLRKKDKKQDDLFGDQPEVQDQPPLPITEKAPAPVKKAPPKPEKVKDKEPPQDVVLTVDPVLDEVDTAAEKTPALTADPKSQDAPNTTQTPDLPQETATTEPSNEPIEEPEDQPELFPVAFSSRRRGAASVPEPTQRPRAELPPLETPDPVENPAEPVQIQQVEAEPASLKTRPSITLSKPAQTEAPEKPEAAKVVPAPVTPPAAPEVISDFEPLDDVPEMPPYLANGTAGRAITPMPMTAAEVAGPTVGASSAVSDRADAAARSLTKTASASRGGSKGQRPDLRKAARVAGSAAGNVVTGTVTGTIGLLGRGTAAGAKRLRKRPNAVAASNSEAAAMTVFGERNQSAVGGKPRFLGLMLTFSLLLALAVLALWSTIFLSDNNPGVFDTDNDTAQIAGLDASDDASAVSEIVPDTESDPSAIDIAVQDALDDTVTPDAVDNAAVDDDPSLETPAIDGPGTAEIGDAVDSVLADLLGPEVAEEPTTTDEDLDFAAIPEPDTQPEPPANPAPDQVLLPPPSRIEAEASYAATGIWQLDPEPLESLPAGDPLEDVFVASVDPDVAGDDLSDLPAAAPLLNDQQPESLLPPAPLGTRFDFDERGLIRATEDGAVTPDGAIVYSGTPPVVPPARPGTEPAATQPEPPVNEEATVETPAIEVPETESPEPEAEPVVEEQTVQEEEVLTPEQLRLQSIRPPLRPGSLEETTNRAVPIGNSLGEVFEGEVDTAEVDSQEVDSALAGIRPLLRPASLQVEVAPVEEAAPEPEVDTGTELAVLISRTPPTRPSNFSTTVERALETVPAKPAPAASPAPSVAAAIVPAVPARASVAKAATERNAINLSKVNLIGVYGSPSDRRALVRLKSGRYVKVEVGDSVDGGRVAAIGDTELRYVKSGRNITLQMPKG